MGSNFRHPFVYGTAWKRDETRELVKQTLEAGFRVVDVTAQSNITVS